MSVHPTLRVLLNCLEDYTAADPLVAGAVSDWKRAGCPYPEPDAPIECPEGWVDVPVLVGVDERGQKEAWAGDMSDIQHVLHETQLDAWARWSTVTVRAPKPAPATDLGTVVAKETP